MISNNQTQVLRDGFKFENSDLFENSKDLFTCVICSGLLRNPQACSKCSSIFCKLCIEKWCKDADFCPGECIISEMEVTDLSPQVKKVLDRLKLICPNKCIIPLTSYHDHLENCDRSIEKVSCWNCKGKAFPKILKRSSDSYIDLKAESDTRALNMIDIYFNNQKTFDEYTTKLKELKLKFEEQESIKVFNRKIFEIEKELVAKETLQNQIDALQLVQRKGDSIKDLREKLDALRKMKSSFSLNRDKNEDISDEVKCNDCSQKVPVMKAKAKISQKYFKSTNPFITKENERFYYAIEMKKNELQCLNLDDENWNFCKSGNHVSTYYKDRENGSRIAKGQVIIEAELDKIISVINSKDYNGYIQTTEVIRKVSDSIDLVYYKTEGKILTAPRDYCIVKSVEQSPNLGVILSTSVNSEFVPEKKECVRAFQHFGCYYIEKANGSVNSFNLTYYSNPDSKTIKVFQSSYLMDHVYKLLVGLKRLCEEETKKIK